MLMVLRIVKQNLTRGSKSENIFTTQFFSFCCDDMLFNHPDSIKLPGCNSRTLGL